MAADPQTTPSAQLVARLRAVRDWWRAPGLLAEEAADEIERLRAVIRVNALRWNPAATDAEIAAVIHGPRPHEPTKWGNPGGAGGQAR